MSRPSLSVMGVIYEALGFAVSRFGTAVRVAWLPLILLMVLQVVLVKLGFAQPAAGLETALRLEPGYTYKFVESLFLGSWTYIGLMAVAVVLQATYMVPLIRYAGTGVTPHAGSLHLDFGGRHLKYVLATAVSFAGIVILMRVAMAFGNLWVNDSVLPILQTQHSVFEPGSLHSVETELVFDDLVSFLVAIEQFLYRIGINMAALDLFVAVPVLVVGTYLFLRFFALTYFAAAREPGSNFTSWGMAWSLSGGRNIFPLVAIILLFILIHLVTYAMLILGMYVFSMTMAGSETLIVSLDWLFPNGSPAPLVRGGLTIIFGLGLIFASTFIAALNAGLGGALVHSATKSSN